MTSFRGAPVLYGKERSHPRAGIGTSGAWARAMSEPQSVTDATTPPPPPTVIEVLYPARHGKIGLRGSHAPLSWEHTEQPSHVDGDRHVFQLDIPAGEIIEMKLVRNEEEWAAGRNYSVHAGDHVYVEPYFDGQSSTLEPMGTLEVEGDTITFEVLLPPGYAEQETKRYPVLYALDGQSLWSTSSDPFGVWGLEKTLEGLHELGAVEELIVVGIHASDRRVERFSPVPDPDHGGGEGPAFLAALTDRLRPYIDAKYRTRTDRESTGIMGSSMGGLFAFFAAWNRPDVFGKAACLSSSFWWARRWAVRMVGEQGLPSPRPMLYVDSGAAWNPHERDTQLRDGFHHTRSMIRALTKHGYTPGSDMHRLVFAGHGHNAEAWSSRVALPLQLLFPQLGAPRSPNPPFGS